MSKTPSSGKGLWSAVPDEQAQGFKQALETLPEVELRKMFGCPCAFVHGQMFAVFHPVGLALKLSEEDRVALLEQAGAKPFEPMPGRKMREYIVLPDPYLSAEESLQTWLHKAHRYAALLPPKRSKQ
jgi:TfoX/Sxy family transcriptional regulator of competence genes